MDPGPSPAGTAAGRLSPESQPRVFRPRASTRHATHRCPGRRLRRRMKPDTSKPTRGRSGAIVATIAAVGPIRRVLGQNSPQDARPVENRFGGGYATAIGCFAVSRTAGLKSACGVFVSYPTFDECPAGRPITEGRVRRSDSGFHSVQKIAGQTNSAA